MNQQLLEYGQEVRVEVSTFSFEERLDIVTRMNVMMMAGDSYDLFYFSPVDRSIWRHSQSGFLANIYTLMDESPNTNREDFFTNVLDAFAIDGNLYAFPLSFGFYHIAINSTLPQEFINRFAEKETVSRSELMHMYLDLQHLHGNGYSHLLLADPFVEFSPQSMLPRAVSDFVDFYNKTANLIDNRFADFFTAIRHVQDFQGFRRDGSRIVRFNFPDSYRRIQNAKQYMFISDSIGDHLLYSFFQQQSPLFLHHTPLATDDGRLLLNPDMDLFPVFSIPIGGQQALAWEFLQHLIRPMVVQIYGFRDRVNFQIPIKRSYFHSNFSVAFKNLTDVISDYFEGMGNAADRETIIQNAKDKLAALSELPMATVPLVPFDLLEDDFNQMLYGLITPEVSAQCMNNRVALWLIE